MPQLSDLYPIPKAYNYPIQNLQLDNRQIKPGDVFFACQGTQQHGRQYIPAAIKAGAAAILIEDPQQRIEYPNKIPHIYIPKLSAQAGQLAAAYYGKPSQQRPLIGITGTNGKTSINHFIAQALQYLGQDCGVLGTLGYGLYPELQLGNNTTPDPLQIQRQLSQFIQAGADVLAIEVSSHALAQNRVVGCDFHSAIFSNLSRDHLDYHRTLANYAAAKAQLFQWPKLQHAIINRDDPIGRELIQNLRADIQCWDYSYQDPKACLYLQIQQQTHNGLETQIHTPDGTANLQTQLVGDFNLSNLVAALGALLSIGIPLDSCAKALSQVNSVSGRMQRYSKADHASIIIDYAHTPDALKQVLRALKPQCTGRLYCVFGCGGDRDQGKRAQMGAIASQHADSLILTNDNPRHEDPETIIKAIESGIPNGTNYHIEPNRSQAIQQAIQQANPEDWILIAGKGHENYQQIGDEKMAFSDAEVVEKAGYQ